MKTMVDILGRGAIYREQLRSKEWKSFASSIRRDRDNGCEACKRADIETHVHHIFYDPYRKAWEYEREEIVLLCRLCHEELHKRLKEFRKYVFKSLTPQSFKVLNGALAVGLTQYDPLRFCYAVAAMASSPGSVDRFCEAWINRKPKQAELTGGPSVAAEIRERVSKIEKAVAVKRNQIQPRTPAQQARQEWNPTVGEERPPDNVIPLKQALKKAVENL